MDLTLVSCPTCGRTCWSLEKVAKEVEARLAEIPDPITVAVMGCVVNGPGEAREADVGIAGGKGEGLLFRKERSSGKCRKTGWLKSCLKKSTRL